MKDLQEIKERGEKVERNEPAEIKPTLKMKTSADQWAD